MAEEGGAAPPRLYSPRPLPPTPPAVELQPPVRPDRAIINHMDPSPPPRPEGSPSILLTPWPEGPPSLLTLQPEEQRPEGSPSHQDASAPLPPSASSSGRLSYYVGMRGAPVVVPYVDPVCCCSVHQQACACTGRHGANHMGRAVSCGTVSLLSLSPIRGY
jgi:hypothetical protein